MRKAGNRMATKGRPPVGASADKMPIWRRAGFPQEERRKMADGRKGRGVAQGLRCRAKGCGLCSRGRLDFWQVHCQWPDEGQ